MEHRKGRNEILVPFFLDTRYVKVNADLSGESNQWIPNKWIARHDCTHLNG